VPGRDPHAPLLLPHGSSDRATTLPRVATEVEALRGQFVIEVGVRQAWPFLTFCDNRPTPPRETRLYIDTAFRVDSSEPTFADGDVDAAAVRLLELSDRTVTDVRVGSGNELWLVFDDGQAALDIEGMPREFTTHDIWWLSERRG
jgi:hypothetical protein